MKIPCRHTSPPIPTSHSSFSSKADGHTAIAREKSAYSINNASSIISYLFISGGWFRGGFSRISRRFAWFGLYKAAVLDNNVLSGLATLCTLPFHFLNYFFPLFHNAKYHVFTVQEGRFDCCYKELAAIRVPAGICHRQNVRRGVPQLKVFVFKLLSVNTFPTRAIASDDVTSLAHEARDNAVKDGALKVLGLSRLALTFFARAQSSKVLCRFRDDIGKELYDNTSSFATADADVEEDSWVLFAGSCGQVESRGRHGTEQGLF